jgi:phosphate transport system substrate-binding protein
MCLRQSVLVVGLLLMSACTGSLGSRTGPVQLRISGSTSMRPLLEDLARSYEAAHAGVRVELSGGDSATGIQDLQSGDSDLAAVSWKTESGPSVSGLQAVPVARDGLVIIVHPANRVSGLTLLQLRALFRGESLDWNALGWTAGEPVIVSREDGSGDRQAFESLVMGGDRVTLNALVMPTASAVVDYVSRHPAAIGYVSLAQIGEAVRPLAIEDAVPSRERVAAGSYHLGRLLYLYTSNAPSATSRSFLDYVLSPAGQAVVSKYHAPVR